MVYLSSFVLNRLINKNMDKKYSFTKEETKDKEIKLNIKVVPEEFVSVKNKAYNKLSQNVEITGFRPGKAPRNLIEARISQELYEETLNKVLPDVTYEIINTEKLSPLNQVRYEVVKMSDAEGVEFNATFVNSPTIKLGDFKKIKIKKEEFNVTDEDVNKELERILKTYGPKDSKELDLKNVTDKMIADMKLGFDTKEKLIEQVKKELDANKKYEQEQKYLSKVLEEAIKSSKIVAPIALVKADSHRREHEYTEQIEKLGLKVDDFLKSQNKTIDDLKKEWDKESQKRIEEELLLYEVIKANNITVTKEEVAKELEAIKDEATKKQMLTDSGIRYITTVILQQKALNFIKSQVNS